MKNFLPSLSTALSSERLESYRVMGDSDFEMVQTYLWNLALCEAIYPALHILEVTLRNSLHNAISARYRTSTWFFDDVPLLERDQGTVLDAEDELRKQRKPIDPGHMVAELSFGFWTSLFASAYGYNLNTRHRRLWPELLHVVFPHMLPRERHRENLAAHFNKIRTLRNRVFHHEPIWNRAELEQTYELIVAAIGWMNSDAKRLTISTCRFPSIFKDGKAPFLRTLQTLNLQEDNNQDT